MALKNNILGLFLTLSLTQGYGCNKNQAPVDLEAKNVDVIQPIKMDYTSQFSNKQVEKTKNKQLYLVSGLEQTVEEDENAIQLFSKQLKLKPKDVDGRYEDNQRVLFDSGYFPLLKVVAPIMDFNGDCYISRQELGDMKLINQAKVKKNEVYQK